MTNELQLDQLQANGALSQLPTSQSLHESTLFTSSSAAQSAMDTVANHPITQNVKDSVQNGEVCRTDRSKNFEGAAANKANQDTDRDLLHGTPATDIEKAYTSILGPVGQKVKEQREKTSSEFQDLSDARRTPDQPTANGQPLTRKSPTFSSFG